MKISTLFLFIFLCVFGCASQATDKNTDVDLTLDFETKNDTAIADVKNTPDMQSDMVRMDVADFDRSKFEMCFEEGVVEIGEVESAILDEISGIAVSRAQDIIWAHNDSGDVDGQFYAIDFDGKLRGTFVLNGANSKDWEDMAIVELEGKTYLYFGDVGDNDARNGNGGRSNTRVYRVEEPIVDLANNANTRVVLPNYETYTFNYPDGATDCESLFVDPKTGDLFFLEKKNNGTVKFFRSPKPADGSTTVLESLVGIDIVPSSDYPGSMTTAGSISPDGRWILVKTYTSVLLFPWRPNQSFSDAVSIPPIILPVPAEIQGESIDFAKNGSGVITISEGSNPAINFIKDTCK